MIAWLFWLQAAAAPVAAPASQPATAPAPVVAQAATAPAQSNSAPAQSASAPAQGSSAPVRVEWPVETDLDRIPKRRTGGNVLLKDVGVLPVTSPFVEKTSILVRGGKIAAIDPKLTAPEGTTVIDGRGLYVAPGSVDCHSHIAIDGDVNEGSVSVSAECKIADVVEPDDVAIYRALAGGSTVNRLLHGSANAIGGEHVVIKLRVGHTANDLLVLEAPRGIKFALGENPKQSNGRAPGRPLRFPATRLGVEAVIRRSFDEANDLIQQRKDDLERIARGEAVPPRRRDLRLETVAAILAGEVAIHSHCYRADEIQMLLDAADAFGVKVRTLQHVLEGYKVAPEIARYGAGASTFSDWWAYKEEVRDANPYNAALMHRAGVLVSLNSDSAELVRRLHIDSAKTIRYGMLTVDEALAMVTINPAKQLGIDARLGSIEVGKDADLAVFDGHPLSGFSKCVMTLVDGEIEFERSDPWAEYTAAFAKAPAKPAARAAFAATTPWAPAPKVAPPPTEKIAIVHGTVVPVGSAAFEDGTVLIEGGKITQLGPGLAAPADAAVIDAKGLFVYPGMIDAASVLGVSEIGSVAATRDEGEPNGMQPDLRVLHSINVGGSEHLRVARANGITTAVVAPTGGTLCGQSALVHLDGWTPAEIAVVDPLALHVNFPSQRADDPDKSADENDKEREKAFRNGTREMRATFERAAAYGRGRRAPGAKGPHDPRLDALVPYALGERPVVFRTGAARDAVGAVRFAVELGLKPVVWSPAHDVAKIAAFLAEHDVPVLLGPVTALPGSRDDRYDAPYSAARVLHAAGVRFAFSTASSSDVRNLPFQAAMSVAYGLPADAALRAVTLGAAEILGVDERLGSLAPGKSADVIVTDGNPLEQRTHVKHAVIGGRRVELTSHHTELYEKFLLRLTPEQRAKAGAPR